MEHHDTYAHLRGTSFERDSPALGLPKEGNLELDMTASVLLQAGS